MKVKILGKGAWGNALYSVITKNCEQVLLLGKEEYSDDQDVLILAVPVQAIRAALQFVSFADRKKIIINTSKGIERTTHLLPQQIVQEVFGESEYYALMGPSFAQEVEDNMLTVVNLAYDEKSESLPQIQKLFTTDYFSVRPTKGVMAMELAAAFKNMYAIVCGLSNGLGYEMNTRVALIIFAMEECKKLCTALQLSLDGEATIGTTGDLILTCNSTESRNFRFGKHLAVDTVTESFEKTKHTVEGFHSLASIEYFEQKAGIELPLARFIKAIVEKNNPANAKEAFIQFMKEHA